MYNCKENPTLKSNITLSYCKKRNSLPMQEQAQKTPSGMLSEGWFSQEAAENNSVHLEINLDKSLWQEKGF